MTMSDHDRYVDPYAERRRRNEESKSWAKRNGEPWSDDEERLLIDEWIDMPPVKRDERTISQILERTIEACRVRCEIIRARQGLTTRHVTTTTTTTRTEYIGAFDDPDDCWWSPDYYR